MDNLAVCMQKGKNRELIEELLASKYRITEAEPPSLLSSSIDLIIADGRTLKESSAEIKRKISREEPSFLPCLLITSRKNVSHITSDLWRSVDEVVTAPVEKRELFARVEILLRSRRLSTRLHGKYRRLFESVPVGLYRANAEGKLKSVNSTLAQILEETPENLRGREISNFLSISGKSELESEWCDLVDGNREMLNCECKLTLNGKDLWARHRARRIEGPTGSWIEGSVEDITARKEASRDREIKSGAVEEAINPMGLADLEGNITYVNDAFLSAWGYDSEEVLGQPASDFWQSPEEAEDILNTILEEDGYRGELEARGADGTTFPVELSASLVTDTRGEPLRLAVSFIDISPLKERQRELEKSRKEYMDLFNGVNDAVFIHDFEGDFLNVNDTALERLGYSREELLALDLAEIMSHVNQEKIERRKKKIKEKGYRTFESAHLTKEGREIPVETTATVINYRGEEAIISVARDITKRKEAQLRLEKSNRHLKMLSRANRALVRATEETELLEDVCEVIVETGDYPLAWVGFARRDEEKTVEPVASAGATRDYLDSIEVSWGEDELGRGPTGEAIKTGRLSVMRDVEENPNYEPWRGEAERRGYRSSVAIPLVEGGETFGALNVYSDEAESFDEEELDLLEELGSDLAYGIRALETKEKHREAEKNLRQSFIQLAETTSRVLGVRDPYTQQHELRVAELAREVGERLGLDEETLLGLYLGGVLHDIGKIVVPETILTKPGELKDVEWEMIKAHPRVGYKQVLKDTDFPWPVAEMTLHHHERLDGSGYPDGLEGEELTTEVRILGACDVVEAMSTRRPYRAPRSKDRTVNVLKDGKGEEFDPEVVEVLLEMIEEGEIEFE